MTKKLTAVIIFLYMIAFTANLAAVIDWNDVFMPASVMIVYPRNRYYAYKEGSHYYLALTGTVEITKGDYKYILGNGDDRHDDPGSEYKYRLKYFSFFEKEYRPERSFTVYRMIEVYMDRINERDSRELSRMRDRITQILDEYGAETGSMKFSSSEGRISSYYGFADPEKNQDAIDKINRKIMAEFAAVYLWDRGEMPLPYPGSNARIIEALTERLTGQDTEEYAAEDYDPELSSYGDLDGLFYRYHMVAHQDRDRSRLSLKAAKYISLRYMEHMPGGRHIIFSKTVTGDNITVMVYSSKGPRETGYIEFEAHDPVSHFLTAINIKLAVMTGGRLPVIPGSYLLIRVLLIAFAQNVVLAIILTFADAVKSRKRRAAIVQ